MADEVKPHHHGHHEGDDNPWNDYERLKGLLNPDRQALFPPSQILSLLQLSEGMAVADVGAGSGFMLDALAIAVGRAGAVRAIDPSPAAIQHLNERQEAGAWPQVTVHQGTAEATGLTDASLGAMLWLTIYHHVEDVPAAFQEVRRVVKSGGRLLIVDWEPKPMEMGPPVEHRISGERARAAAEAAGLQVEGLGPLGDAAWALVLTCP